MLSSNFLLLPLGELFDHGCDSWATILLPLGLISAIGRGVEFGGTPTDSLLPCISTIAGFYLFHWEKYITGCLYIPWFYDLIQLVSVRACEITLWISDPLLRHILTTSCCT